MSDLKATIGNDRHMEENRKETIKFRIVKVSDDMCRIAACDCRTVYRKIADGACICSIEVMLSEMESITKEVENLGNRAIFVFD